jgi:Rod binding domain-containing protein
LAAILPVDRAAGALAAVDLKPVASGSSVSMPSAKAGKAAEAFRQFEAFVLQSFIETMLPKNAEAVFGKGTAGAIWKSMLAEKLADQISRNGGVGIAQRIAGASVSEVRPASGEARPPVSEIPAAGARLLSEQRGDDA